MPESQISKVLYSERDNELITEPEKIKYLLEKYLIKKSLIIKDTFPPVEVIPTDTRNDVLKLRIPVNFQSLEKLILYTDIIKHIELDTELVKKLSLESIEVRVLNIKIAKMNRLEKRVKTNLGSAVHISNFRMSKNILEKNPMAYSISNKVIFNEFEKELKTFHPGGIIREINPSDISFETRVVKKGKKGLIIQSIGDKNDIPAREDMFFLEGSFRDELIKSIVEYEKQSVKSFLIKPFYYETNEKEKIPMGYIFLKSKEINYTFADYDKLEDLCASIINRIKDANMITLPVQQKVLDIGNGGILAEIDDPQLKNYIKNRKEFTFDVVFRLQQPLRFYGTAKHIRKNAEGNLIAGIEFSGIVQSDAGNPAVVKKKFQEHLNHLIRHSV